jgi:ATP-binding cassette, subfamily B, bacterial
MLAYTAPRTRGELRIANPFLRPEARGLAVATGAAVLETGCRLLAPWPMALAVDHALGGRPLDGPAKALDALTPTGLLLVSGVVLLAITAVGGLLDLCVTMLTARAAERAGGVLRRTTFAHVLTLSLRWHDRMRTGEVISRLTADVGRVVDAVIATFTTLLPDLVLLAGALVLMFLVDPGLAWLGLTVLPLLAWLTVRRRGRVRAAELDAREASGRLAAVTTDLLRNVRAVQAFAQQDRAIGLFGVPNGRLVGAEIRAMTVSARWTPLLDLVLATGSGIVLVAGGLQVLDGRITVGQLLVVLSYLSGLHNPVRGLVRLVGMRSRATASAQRLGDILACTEAVPEPADPRPAPSVREGLRLDAVTFSYAGDRPVLRDFDLWVAAGETVCLFGPSGAGKSTVLHLLLRLYDPDAGRVLVDGVDVREIATAELRRQLAFVPQDPWLLDGTIAENIAFGRPGATRAEILAAGRAAWVDEFALSFPDGYDTPLGESGVMLSGGQRRRVALARAAVSPAPVVLLDEPTTSLDAASARQVIGAIRSATVDRTVVLVTHDPVLAAIADRTVSVSPLRAPVADPLPETPVLPLRTAGEVHLPGGSGDGWPPMDAGWEGTALQAGATDEGR